MQSVSKAEPALKKGLSSHLLGWIKKSKREGREHAAATAAIFVFTIILFAPVLFGKTFSMVGAHMYGEYPWTAVVRPLPSIGGLGCPQPDEGRRFQGWHARQRSK